MKKDKLLWREIENKEDQFYIPLLNAFINELKCLEQTHSSKIPEALIAYLLGRNDFYKIIAKSSNATTQVQVFNFKGTLNQSYKNPIVKINNDNSEKIRKLLKPFPMLILFYMLPQEGVEELELLNLPRNPLEFILDINHWGRLYFSKAFPKRLMELWAELMWRFLDIKGYRSDYCKSDPMYILLHDPDIWIEVSKIIFRDENHLISYAETLREIPYWTMDEMCHKFEILANHFWNHPKIKGQEVYKVVEYHRTHNDYSARWSNVKKDFKRSWNHTQASIKTVSYELVEHEANQILHTDVDLESIDFNDALNGFVEKLEGKHDKTIFRLLYLGHTQEQIAEYLGYASHTTVSKRLAIIRKEYLKHYKKSALPKPKKETIEKYA